jgi:GSH-dependent disulfide-bond oxidoreductase
MKLYYDLSPCALQVALLLAELNIAYEPIPLDIRKNPEAKVPLLQDGDLSVFDSTAILLYLAEKENKLFPSIDYREQRAKTLSWLTFISTDVENACTQARHFRYVAPKPNDYALRLFDYELNRHLTSIEQHLAKHTFMTGDHYSIVDIAFWSWARLLPNVFGVDQTLWQRYPNVKRLADLIEQRPAVREIELLKTRHNFKVARRYRPAPIVSSPNVEATL